MDQDTSTGVAAGYRPEIRVTLAGAVVNLALAGAKVAFGVIGHSQALVVDGVHSLSDLASDTLVLFAARSAGRSADAEHPYGHARYETAATMVIGAALLGVAGGFAYEAAGRLAGPGTVPVPGAIVLAAALGSVVAKEVVYRFTVGVGRRTGSSLIVANAWHHRSDALSSLVVIVGVLGSMAGLAWFDAATALVVAAMVGVVGWRFVRDALRELVDTGVDPATRAELHTIIDAVAGVRSHHRLRTRYMAGRPLVDVHLVVDPRLAVAAGHRIGEAVDDALRERLGQSTEVLVHIDAGQPSTAAPPRAPLCDAG